MKNSGWRRAQLSDVVTLQRGHDLPTTDRNPGTVPILGSFGVTGWHDTAKVTGPGVTIGRSGASIGVATYTDLDYWPLNTALYVRDFKGNDPRWVYWLLHSIDFTGYNSGSAQPSLNRNYLTAIPIRIPSIGEQRRIAGVLGALDNLIDTNEQLIAGILALADTVALTPATDSTVVSFADVCDVGGGGTPSTKNESYWGGDIPWATPTDFTALPSPYLFRTRRSITDAGFAACSSRLYPAGSILMTSRATIGSIAFAQLPTAINQGFIAVEPRDTADRYFLFHEMRRRVPDFISRANGSTFLEISRGVFKSLEVSWPTKAEREKLARQLEPLHDAAASLQEEIEDVRRTRDELLPLLMSGKVRVAPTETGGIDELDSRLAEEGAA